MIDVDEADACTEDAILGQPEEIQRMLGAAVSRDISSLARCALHAPVGVTRDRIGAAVSHDLLVALDRVGDFVAFRALANTTNATAARALRTRRV